MGTADPQGGLAKNNVLSPLSYPCGGRAFTKSQNARKRTDIIYKTLFKKFINKSLFSNFIHVFPHHQSHQS